MQFKAHIKIFHEYVVEQEARNNMPQKADVNIQIEKTSKSLPKQFELTCNVL